MDNQKEPSNVRILVVDDDPENLTQVEKWLQRFGYHHVDFAESAKATQLKLADHRYDIIVADMRMEADDSGFVVVEEVKRRNLSSVVIILTANDTVADCRHAFKTGAWDYISKNMRGNVFNALDDSIKQAIEHFNRRGNVNDEEWIAENIEQLRQDYLGKYIAVINHSVIEVADSESALKKKLQAQKFPLFLTVLKNIDYPRPIAELIKAGESDSVEFKSTFQWDVYQNKKNKNLQHAVLKTVAAFLNSEGGTLLIGVQDDGSIFGLARDLSLLSKKSLDQFEQTLMNLISDRIGASFVQFVKVRFKTIDDQYVGVLLVSKAPKPAFLKSNKVKEFYIRTGGGSRQLDVEEAINYAQMR